MNLSFVYVNDESRITILNIESDDYTTIFEEGLFHFRLKNSSIECVFHNIKDISKVYDNTIEIEVDDYTTVTEVTKTGDSASYNVNSEAGIQLLYSLEK